MSVLAAIFERYMPTQQEVDAKRRDDLLYYFQEAAQKKTQQRVWQPANVGFLGARKYPNIVIDNWAAAWKVRRHFEEASELRRAAGKPVY